MLVYDATNRESFESALSDWLPRIRAAARDNPGSLLCTLLVGNKTDLLPAEGCVTKEEHERAVAENGVDGAWLSAVGTQGVDEAFHRLVFGAF